MYNKWLPFINKHKIILASGSPQRKSLLESLGFIFEVIPSNFPENLEKTNSKDYVKLTSEKKFESFLSDNPNLELNLLISADTIVEHNGLILEKPLCDQEIYDWFGKYSNNKVTCYTSVVYGFIKKNEMNKNECFNYHQFISQTDVYFDELSEELISDYVETKQHYGKAGGFAIQGLAKTFIKKLDGSYENVIGFPIGEFTRSFLKVLVEIYGPNGWKENNTI